MEPQSEKDKLFLNQGVTYNISVHDVDHEYEELLQRDAPITEEIANKPWGDRSFITTDPNGVRLYIYSDREPSEEFLSAFK